MEARLSADEERRLNAPGRLQRLAAALGVKHAHSGGGVPGQLRKGTNRAGFEIAAAIGTMSAKLLLRAVAAEGALEGADHGIRGVGRQVSVTAFAVGTQFEHRKFSGKRNPTRWAVGDALVNPS